MTTPENHFSIEHGSLSVNVPMDLFIGPDCKFDEMKVKEFRAALKSRYPWLSEGSLDVLMNTAKKEMIRIKDENDNGRALSRLMASEGKIDEAIKHMQKHLEKKPDDADSWYVLGELLCSAGRTEEGYKAMNRGRSLF